MIKLAYLANEGVLSDEDAKKLTHVHVAFGRLEVDGSIRVEELNIFKDMERIRKANPRLKILVSVVVQHPDAFTVCAASEQLRKAVGASCVKLITEYGFDGVDFDWEYPCVPSNGMHCKPEDQQNFTCLLQEVRRQMKSARADSLLSIAAGADLYYVESIEPEKVAACLDYICLMTYDLKCGFHSMTGHHTALYSSTGDIFRNSGDQALRLFHARGIPKEKLLLGAAFYSRKWTDLVSCENNGFLQATKTSGGYGPGFDSLQESFVGKNGYTRYWDEEAKAPYLFNGETFYSYDDVQSLTEKCSYVQQNGYGGLFYWEHSCDKTGTLLEVIHQNL